MSDGICSVKTSVPEQGALTCLCGGIRAARRQVGGPARQAVVKCSSNLMNALLG